jgi:predicted metal-dependent phosphoesterase TrpH
MKEALQRCPILHPPASYFEKILTPQRAAWVEQENWYASDLHVHSFCSGDVLPAPENDPLRLYEEGRRRGLKYITVTDHDTMDAYDRLGWEREGLVPGVEFKILDKQEVGHTIHVNVYLLDKHQFGELDGIARRENSLDRFLAFLQENDLPHVYNHPFWFEEGERPNPEGVIRTAKRFPVLEYNRGRIRSLNLLALALAEEYETGIVASSDSHTAENMGIARTYAKGDTFREYFSRIAEGNAYILPLDMTLPRLVEESNQWIELILGVDQMTYGEQIAAFDMNVKPLDWILRSMAGDGLMSKPWFRRTLRRLLRAGSDAGVIQSFYIRGQDTVASRITRDLGLSGNLLDAA